MVAGGHFRINNRMTDFPQYIVWISVGATPHMRAT